ncbi:flavin-dependent oxidoreductase [SAR116 cluster bacterium]|nr:flavin-dependent oxidoreductase [SAR116 cluster bacterium]
MNAHPVVIAGGGIGGLVMALTLHQIGVPCQVYESVKEMQPLGVGINLQPNAVRELIELGIDVTDLDSIGIQSSEWALLGLNGAEIYSESRGLKAGYKWPQYAAHRGQFHMLLYRKVVERLGVEAVKLGHRLVGYDENNDSSVTVHIETDGGNITSRQTSLLIGADGIHSKIRAQMHPSQPPIHWGGTLMWRGTTRMRPLRTGSSFLGLGTQKNRVIVYPISGVDADGLAATNWIAEVVVDPAHGWEKSGWFRSVETKNFVHHFNAYQFDWLNVPAMINDADAVYENPMIDRDPLDFWIDNRVALLGDAAHPMYPTGSNGASQAIIDTRILGKMLVLHGLSPDALKAYDDALCSPIGNVVLRNRQDGPFGLLTLVEERCGGVFEDINDVISEAERTAFMAHYKTAAGFAMETVNNAASLIEKGAKLTPV